MLQHDMVAGGAAQASSSLVVARSSGFPFNRGHFLPLVISPCRFGIRTLPACFYRTTTRHLYGTAFVIEVLSKTPTMAHVVAFVALWSLSRLHSGRVHGFRVHGCRPSCSGLTVLRPKVTLPGYRVGRSCRDTLLLVMLWRW
jgi:hypothetical protein